MEVLNALVAVEEINSEIYEQLQDEAVFLEYCANGYGELIEFLGIVIWNSEDDPRPYLLSDEGEEQEERMDLQLYLRQEITRIIMKLNTLNLFPLKGEGTDPDD
jgi:hypothetical protein